jgi:hypothetical protein
MRRITSSHLSSPEHSISIDRERANAITPVRVSADDYRHLSADLRSLVAAGELPPALKAPQPASDRANAPDLTAACRNRASF